MNKSEDVYIGVPYELTEEEISETAQPGAFCNLMGGQPI
jgi:hypothetical protein